MVVGVGTDIIEIERVKQACENPRFLSRFFTKEEQSIFEGKRMETVAGNFACKEAAAKALGTGFRGFTLKDVEILRDKWGKPVVVLHGKALEMARSRGIDGIYASISHCDLYATAFVVMESAEVGNRGSIVGDTGN